MLSDLVISVLALYSKEISKSVNEAFVHRYICYRIIYNSENGKSLPQCRKVHYIKYMSFIIDINVWKEF